MEQNKSLTLNGMTGKNFLFILNAAVMVGVGVYLTSHYYSTLFPERLGGGSTLCDISQFFNCDTATYSPLAAILGVPTSIFGLIMGVLFLFTSIFPSKEMEQTASALSKYNFIGCIFLFLYSLIILGSLCPMCTLYYFLSGLAFFMFYKYGVNSWKPEFKSLAVWGVILLVTGFFMNQYTSGKADRVSKLNNSVIDQFKNLPDLGEPDQESPYKLATASVPHAEAPIRISVFSDFQCPFCKMVSEQMPDLARRYPGKVSIQYFFYPLDQKCNSNIERRFHEYACDAAFVAACDEKKFGEVHDEIFAIQEKLNDQTLRELAQKHNLVSCLNNEEVKNKVIQSINLASKFNIKSTPTIIINGRKIEGSVPNNQFFAIFDYLLQGK